MTTSKIENRDFAVSIPSEDGKSIDKFVIIKLPMEWDDEIGEWLMTEEGVKLVEKTKSNGETDEYI